MQSLVCPLEHLDPVDPFEHLNIMPNNNTREELFRLTAFARCAG
jgi:hypothetical protein